MVTVRWAGHPVQSLTAGVLGFDTLACLGRRLAEVDFERQAEERTKAMGHLGEEREGGTAVEIVSRPW